ncbi:MAG: SHOCT domain-containing protein [Gemmatimonadota bacterium]
MADGQGMGMGGGMGWGWGMMGIFGLLFWLAVFVLVVVIIWRLLPGRGGSSDRNGATALDILERRYARGEIGREEFETKKQDISRG